MFLSQPDFLIHELLQPVLKMFIKVSVKQFRKDMSSFRKDDSINIAKKEAHRKAF